MADQIVDACCLINLYASGRIQDIIPACGGNFYVSEQVRRESMSIRQVDPADTSLLIPSPINLALEISRGLIKECCLETKEEIESYVNFSIEVDDGEASSLAIAKSRNWMVATGDRKAIRLASESGIAVITTPELVERWANITQSNDDAITQTIRAIERFARFRPRRGSPLHDWWSSKLPSE
jgi:predicted nucleic acid-binding protein